MIWMPAYPMAGCVGARLRYGLHRIRMWWRGPVGDNGPLT